MCKLFHAEYTQSLLEWFDERIKFGGCANDETAICHPFNDPGCRSGAGGLAVIVQMVRIQTSEQAKVFLSQGDRYAGEFQHVLPGTRRDL